MVKTKKEEELTIKSIIENTPETFYIPEFGNVTVRCPTTGEKLDAKREALKITEGLTEFDTNVEHARILAMKMIIKPKITVETYLDSNDARISIVLDTVHMWYNKKMAKLNESRQELIRDFLELKKES